MGNPIEVVVIRDLVLRAPPVGGPPEFTAEQRRELAAVLEALHCDVRQRILLALASARPSATPGPDPASPPTRPL